MPVNILYTVDKQVIDR